MVDKATVWVKYGWAICMAIWVFVGAILVVISLYQRTIGTLFLVAFSVFSATGVMGFLLGMRGVSSNASPTHLQQIADWLTKLLLGAGLVEIKSISQSAWVFAQKLGVVIDETHGPYIALSVAVGFGALGAISGYLWSQLHYGNATPPN